MDKDYYRILGVLDDAEDIIIRAAYKALAQRYHPDKWLGSPEEANRRMAEINEAYSVLSDPIKRKQYDDLRDQSAYQEEDASDDLTSSIEKDWQVVTEYFPDLVEISQRLQKISKTLASSYQIYMLETKDFGNRQQIAENLEDIFFEKYFGTNPKIKSFAKNLILMKRGDVAKELNTAVTLLGTDVNPQLVIKRLRDKFHLRNETDEEVRIKAMNIIQTKDFQMCEKFIAALGGEIARLPSHFFGSIKIGVRLHGRESTYEYDDFIKFATRLAEDFLAEN
jgi:hypothetical protein|uniref:J domain-containing protein n=1 Tax=Orrella sp. TaxID=1921583 RepID=UPI00404775FF